jgi:hypothetical protein
MKTLNILLLAAFVSILLSSFLISAAEVEPSCIQNALIKRETAIGTAFQKFVMDLTLTAQKKTNALVAAYALEDKKARNNAIRLAWKTYKEEYKAISTEFKNSRKSAWNTFKEDRSVCKTPKESADSESNEIRL